MSDYLKLQITSFTGGVSAVQIEITEGIVQAEIKRSGVSKGSQRKVLSSADSEAWLKDFAALKITAWKTDYPADPPVSVMESETWFVEYKVKGRKIRLFKGENNYPENWKDFLNLVDRLIDLRDPGALDGFCLVYRRLQRSADQSSKITADQPEYYTETLKMDRETQTLIYERYMPNFCTQSEHYHVPRELRDLLNTLAPHVHELIEICAAKPLKPIPPDAENAFELTLDFHRIPQVVLRGEYGRRGLPETWEKLMDVITDFMIFFEHPMRVVDPGVYRHGVKAGEHIYCHVKFPTGNQIHHYSTDDDRIEMNDLVWVPTGREDEIRLGRVVFIEYSKRKKTLYPREEIRKIVRKADPQEFSDTDAFPEMEEALGQIFH